MRNHNSKLAFDQTWGWETVLGAVKTNITPVCHNSLTITKDGDLILIRFHESLLLIQLIVPQDGMELCPPPSLVALCRLYYLLLWLHSSLCPECGIALTSQAPHCAPPDKTLISLGPADSGKTYPSSYFYAPVLVLCLSLSSFLFWVSGCATVWRGACL